MIDIEKEYQDIEAERKNGFISLYGLFVFIRKHNPKSSDNKIATVLLRKFKDYQDQYNRVHFMDTLIDGDLTTQERQFLELGPLLPFRLPKKLHESEAPLPFDYLISTLEEIEDCGINKRTPF
ncbi:hypothetical protein BKK47_09895 [Rodentibacter mrazii]|uniref:Uncharacterized protein n=1 Tax=Rodentibacter mrazii TaxID=1908257 RepID=A0A1V3IDR6_9PAST|nr:hypothetical protein [Rodentibacter mrazii]OOF38186.1 hypothetical protein BKK47_09895 [Rodentibacter mrazii]